MPNPSVHCSWVRSRPFRFLVTGDANTIFGNKTHQFSWKPYLVDGFSNHETKQYLAEFNIDNERIKEIQRATNGIPAKLASVKRLLLLGRDTREVTEQCDESLTGFFEIEWGQISAFTGTNVLLVLAVLAFDEKDWSIEDLASITQQEDEEVLRKQLAVLTFITKNTKGQVQYVSDAFRRYVAESKLRDYRNEALDKIIERLLVNPDSTDTLVTLPTYLERAGREKEILNYLSSDNLDKLVAKTKTLATVFRNVDVGIGVSHRLKVDEDYAALILSRSLLSEIWAIGAWKEEVDALLAIGKYDEALSIASGALLAEDQLQLFCLLARWKKENGEDPETVLLERINELYKKLDPVVLGHEKSIDIAGDLFGISPDLAIDLVTRSVGGDDSENALDWALAKLSIAATQRQDTDRGIKDALEILRDKITSTGAKNIFSVVSMLAGPSSCDEVIAELKKLEKTSDRLLLLRQWIVENKKRSDIGRAIQFALDLSIGDTAYSPNAGFYRDLTVGLREIKDLTEFSNLVDLFDGQRRVVLNKGPTHEYVRFQLNIAQAEIRRKLDRGATRLEELYLEVIYGLTDPTVRGICLAWFLGSLKLNDRELLLEKDRQLHSVVKSDLDKCIGILLTTTADHYEVMKGILEPLAISLPEFAFETANRLNTQSRRDEANANIIEKIAKGSDLDALRVEMCINVVLQILSLEGKNRAILGLVKGVERNIQKNPDLIECIDKLANTIGGISTLTDRCIAFVSFYRCRAICESKRPSNNQTLNQVAEKLKSNWELIVTPWKKISAAFGIASGLAKVAPELANNYISYANEVRKLTPIGTIHIADCVRLAINLLLQAARGLIYCGVFSRDEFNDLARLLSQIPCPVERINFWSKVACAYQIKELSGDVRKIVSEKVLPALREIAPNDGTNLSESIIFAAPALWYAHKETCVEWIEKLNTPDRDAAYFHICSFIFRKILPGDPYEPSKRENHAVGYLEIKDAIEILRKVEGDSVLNTIVMKISDATIYSQKRAILSRDQLADIATRTESAILGNLPDRLNIQHQGYVITANALIGKLRNERSSDFWKNLTAQAEKIPNVADRAIVLSVIASAMPSALRNLQAQNLDQAEICVKQMPSEHDKMDRYETLAETAFEIDTARAKKYLKEAFKGISDSNDTSLAQKRRRLIDLAHRFDPDLPTALATIVDDDPARESVKKQVKKIHNFNEIKKALSNEKSSLPEHPSDYIDYANAAWKLLGALNANRISPVKIEKVRDILRVAREIPLHLSFPIVSYAYENVIRTYSTGKQAPEYIHKFYRASSRMVDMAYTILSRSSPTEKKLRWLEIRKAEENAIVVEPGSREETLAWIREWIRSSNGEELIICDPYFTAADLGIIKLIQDARPELPIQIIASLNENRKQHNSSTFAEEFRSKWRRSIADQDPPNTRIVLCETTTHKFPIHDRWLLTEQQGIRLGTSINSLGTNKLSEISFMQEDEALVIWQQLNKYLKMQEQYFHGEKLIYEIFNLV